jgi:hypothetical protein
MDIGKCSLLDGLDGFGDDFDRLGGHGGWDDDLRDLPYLPPRGVPVFAHIGAASANTSSDKDSGGQAKRRRFTPLPGSITSQDTAPVAQVAPRSNFSHLSAVELASLSAMTEKYALLLDADLQTWDRVKILHTIFSLLDSHRRLSVAYPRYKKSHILEIKELLKEGMELKCGNCAYDLGVIYLTSEYSDILDIEKAGRAFAASHRFGNELAYRQLLICNLRSDRVDPQVRLGSFNELNRDCRDDSFVQIELARYALFVNQQISPEDKISQVRRIQRLAVKNLQALYLLSRMHEVGFGCKQDTAYANLILENAAHAGSQEARIYLQNNMCTIS